MTRRLTKLLLVIFLIATSIGVLISAKSLLIPKLYYPYAVITLPENIRIQFLQRGQKQPFQCERSLASQITAITSTCPICRIEIKSCETDIDNTRKQWLNEDPLMTASARMPYGVVVFDAPQQQASLAMCMGSEKQSLANEINSRVKCFPAGTKRSFQSNELNIVEREHTELNKSLEMYLALIVGMIVLVVASVTILHRLAANGPEEDASTKQESGQIATLKVSNILKRVIDILIAITLLTLLLPILLLIALMILILEGYPVFYISHRFITSENSVTIYKFRTMVRDAVSPKYRLNERYMRDGFLDIPLECEVYTSIGRILERTQLVETLQCLNILFDGMSFVGNRPLPKNNIELLKKFRGWDERFYSPAGITGISQIVGKYGLLPHQRLHLERMYSNIYINPNGNILLCDFYIIGYTVLLLLTGKYLDYDKAMELMVRCGANKELPAYTPDLLERNVTDNA